MKQFSAILACVAVLLLPSCIMRSNIGKNIREPGTVYTSVYLRPVDGTIYRTPQQEAQKAMYCKNPAYARLTEVSFRKASRPWFEAHSILIDDEPKPHSIRPTGKVRLAEIGVRYDGCPDSVTALVDAIPVDAKEQKAATLPDEEEIALDKGAVHAQVSWGRRLAAAPFDYLIDPILSVSMYAGYGVGVVAVSPFAGIYYLVDSSCDQQQKKNPQPTSAPD